jgi:hypothetical protein
MKSTEEIIRALRKDYNTYNDGYVDEAADRLEELLKERAEMAMALRNRRYRDRIGHGMTLRDSAAVYGVSATKLSKWIAIEATTEPDFVD